MKKLLILVMAAMTTMTASAQIEDGNWYVTPKVGVSVADMTSALFNSKQAEVDYNADLKPIVSFTAGADFEYGLETRVGLHCAPNAHKTLGTFPTGTIRFSFGIFNTEEDIDAAIRAITEIVS